jgi:hypothetical protein
MKKRLNKLYPTLGVRIKAITKCEDGEEDDLSDDFHLHRSDDDHSQSFRMS